ncbi:hypothetical protein O9G_004029 [Rozella allomycis CSF55]|uniref:Uncharacterized protein n=1 Tax=Rozella allomycis (strain CSF55) TaxID=988480 RepID=A0A075AWU0_ROZAC|nr:hypothetical protein O9G_004029 [Rozella allomycis CSF55]|eukprot:EPZ34722.1 hypothetical protein O9G_004029 [Rozella allomycis CSF55]
MVGKLSLNDIKKATTAFNAEIMQHDNDEKSLEPVRFNFTSILEMYGWLYIANPANTVWVTNIKQTKGNGRSLAKMKTETIISFCSTSKSLCLPFVFKHCK